MDSNSSYPLLLFNIKITDFFFFRFTAKLLKNSSDHTSCNIKSPCSSALKLFNTWRHTSPTQNNTRFVARSIHMYSRNRTCLFTVSSTQAACQEFKMVYRMCFACNSIMVSLKSVACYFVWRFLCLNAAPAQIISDIQIFFINYINFHFNGSISSHNNLAHAKGATSVFT